MSIDRRAFIRSLGGQAVRSVGAAMALSGQVRQQIVGELFEDETATPLGARPPGDVSTVEPVVVALPFIQPVPAEGLSFGPWSEEPVFASLLVDGPAMHVLDQRLLPHEVRFVRLEAAGEVVHAMREGVIDGGLASVLAAVQVVAMVAARASDGPETSRRAIVSGAARALAGARPDIPLVRQALHALIPDDDDQEIPAAEALFVAADTLRGIILEEHRRLAAAGGAWLSGLFGSQADLMLVGEFGPAATGSIGTTSAIVCAAADLGMNLRVWLPDGYPPGRGAALLASALGSGSIEVHSFPDYRLYQVLKEHHVRTVLLAASWVITESGTIAGQLGCVAAALVARELGIPVVGAASRSMLVRGGAGREPSLAPRKSGAIPLELVSGRLVDAILTDAGPIGAAASVQLT